MLPFDKGPPPAAEGTGRDEDDDADAVFVFLTEIEALADVVASSISTS